jgi:hypothetical protein
MALRRWSKFFSAIPTSIYAEPGGDAQRLYTRLGFRTVAQNITRSFIR